MNTIKTPQADILQSQTNAENPDKQNSSEELIQREDIEGTPFQIITIENKSWLAMGIIKLSPDLKTKKEVEDWLTKNRFNVTVNMIGGMIQLNNEYEKKYYTEQFGRLNTQIKELLTK